MLEVGNYPSGVGWKGEVSSALRSLIFVMPGLVPGIHVCLHLKGSQVLLRRVGGRAKPGHGVQKAAIACRRAEIGGAGTGSVFKRFQMVFEPRDIRFEPNQGCNITNLLGLQRIFSGFLGVLYPGNR